MCCVCGDGEDCGLHFGLHLVCILVCGVFGIEFPTLCPRIVSSHCVLCIEFPHYVFALHSSRWLVKIDQVVSLKVVRLGGYARMTPKAIHRKLPQNE